MDTTVRRSRRASLAAVAVAVLALALGAALLGPAGVEPPPVGTETTPTQTPIPPATATAARTAAPTPVLAAPLRVYYARDQLPPIGVTAPMPSGERAEERIVRRIEYLQHPGEFGGPAGTINAVALMRLHTAASPSGGTPSTSGLRLDITGDLATVAFDVADWGVRGAAQTQALLQQLVYTITEELGIRRVLIEERGRPNAVIDQLVIDKPLTRVDVSGYGFAAKPEIIGSDGEPRASMLTTSYSVDQVAPGLARFVIRVIPSQPGADRWTPKFTVSTREAAGGEHSNARWIVTINVERGTDTTTAKVLVDSTPLRDIDTFALRSGGSTVATVYSLGLDDTRPWRVSLLQDPVRIVIDVGGHPRALSESVAVYAPRPNDEVAREFTISGLARAFEASVSWRLKDSNVSVVAEGNTTASVGTSAVWGGYQTTVRVPSGVTGNVTLEVFWPSPRDGSDVGRVSIPLRVR